MFCCRQYLIVFGAKLLMIYKFYKAGRERERESESARESELFIKVKEETNSIERLKEGREGGREEGKGYVDK